MSEQQNITAMDTINKRPNIPAILMLL